MGYTYDIKTSKKDSTSSNCLFACHTMGAVISTFVSTFLVAYIYQFSNNTFDYIKNVGIYYLCVYATFFLTYWFFSFLTDITDRIWIYRLAQIFRLVFVIVIIFFGKDLAKLLYLAGFIYGLSEACYYGSYNVLKQEMVSRKSMRKFSILITAASKSMDIIVPVTLGALIQVSTYNQASIYVAVIIAAILILSFWIKSRKPEGSSYSLKNYFDKLRNAKAIDRKKISHVYVTSIVYGFTTITNQLLNVCIMLQFGSSLSLGSITSIIGAITIVELLLVTRFTKAGKRDWLYYIVVSLPFFASIIFTIYPSMITVIAYNFLMMVSKIIFSAVFDVFRNGTLKEAGLYSEIAEHQTIVETLLGFSRVLSFSIMIVVGLFKNLTLFYILLIVFSTSYGFTNLSLFIHEIRFSRVSADGTIERSKKESEKVFNNVVLKLKKNNW